MACISFTCRMGDGAEFLLGSTYAIEFFEMPEGYTAERVAAVIRHDRADEPAGKTFRESFSY